jgi:hypothetical protein
VRDTITNSAPSATSTHTIEFTLTNSVPAGGQIVLTPQDSRFTIHSAFSYTDVDFATAPGMIFSEHNLAAVESATEHGVYVTTGTHGSIRFVLNSTSGLSAGERVRIILGQGASFGAMGSSTITNHSAIGSYRIGIETKDVLGNRIDQGTAMIAVVRPIAVSSVPIAVPPTRSSGLPAGTIEANSSSVELYLQTNLPATCRYSTTPNTAYAAMTGIFTTSSFGMVFTTTVTGLSNGATYTYYVRCDAVQGAVNTDDYVISFTLKPTPSTNTSGDGGGGGSSGSGGVGPYPGGSAVLYKSNVTLAGWTSPNGTIQILRDGIVSATTQATQTGSFKTDITGLERGVYTFAISSKDADARETGLVSTTLTLNAGTNNTVTDIVLPPTLSAPAVGAGEDVIVSGYAVPSSLVELLWAPEKTATAVRTYSTTTSAISATRPGAWSITIPAKDVSRGVYIARVRVSLGTEQRSDLSPSIRVGVGESTGQGGMRSDLNNDKKVNLVDFSILLSNWGTDGVGDINTDGTVNLADFSILLFDWTG